MLREAIHKSTFIKYNAVAMTATTVDFLFLVFLTEVLGFWYLLSAIIGSTFGGIVAFMLERNWTFKKTNGVVRKQALRYLFIWLSSLLLNTVFLYLFVDIFEIQYILSRLIVAVLVSVTFNYFTHKYYIFK